MENSFGILGKLNDCKLQEERQADLAQCWAGRGTGAPPTSYRRISGM